VEDLEGEICGIQLDSATKDLLEKAEVISKDGEDYIFFLISKKIFIKSAKCDQVYR
jgi:hypothetical protein